MLILLIIFDHPIKDCILNSVSHLYLDCRKLHNVNITYN